MKKEQLNYQLNQNHLLRMVYNTDLQGFQDILICTTLTQYAQGYYILIHMNQHRLKEYNLNHNDVTKVMAFDQFHRHC